MLDNKKEIVYYTNTYDTAELDKISIYCKENAYRMVLLIPVHDKDYPIAIKNCFSMLGDDLLLYELEMGLTKVLKKAAERYIEQYKDSVLWIA